MHIVGYRWAAEPFPNIFILQILSFSWSPIRSCFFLSLFLSSVATWHDELHLRNYSANRPKDSTGNPLRSVTLHDARLYALELDRSNAYEMCCKPQFPIHSKIFNLPIKCYVIIFHFKYCSCPVSIKSYVIPMRIHTSSNRVIIYHILFRNVSLPLEYDKFIFFFSK